VILFTAALFALNLLPVFPMDGGRILRATLTMVLDERFATLAAARLGQIISLASVIAGIYWQIVPLVLIGLFLVMMAEQEIRQLQPGPAT
jgi:Zn-dependent protease